MSSAAPQTSILPSNSNHDPHHNGLEPHEHEHHGHHHEHGNMPQLLKWTAIAGNLGIAAVGSLANATFAGAQGLTSFLRIPEHVTEGSNGASISDAAHGAGDAVGYALHGRNRKLLYGAIAGPSAFVAVKSYWNALGTFAGRTAEAVPTVWNTGTAIGSVALNMALFGGMVMHERRQRSAVIYNKDTDKEVNKTHKRPVFNKDLLDHFRLDTESAAVALGGIVLQHYGQSVWASLAATAVSARMAWRFRPTRKNLARHHEHQEIQPKRPGLRRKIGAFGLAVCMGVGLAGAASIGKNMPPSQTPAVAAEEPAAQTQQNRLENQLGYTLPGDSPQASPGSLSLRWPAENAPVVEAKAGWGWYHVFKELDIRHSRWHGLLGQAAPDLLAMDVAYAGADGEIKIARPGSIPTEATAKILRLAA